MEIIKRNGTPQPFDARKIRNAIRKANATVSAIEALTDEQMDKITDYVTKACEGYERAVGVEEIQDIVEKQLMAMGAYDVAKNYIIYRKKRERARNTIQIRTGGKDKGDITDQSLLLVNSMTEGAVTAWERNKITARIANAIGLDWDKAAEIAKDVESQIIASGLTRVSTALIRELVNNALIDRGFNGQLQDLTMYRVPRDFIWNLMGDKNNENSNIASNNPEAVSFDIASLVLKQFAFDAVFSKEVADAHTMGLVHVHDANFPHRYYCGSHSIEYIKKYGLKGLVTLGTTSKPAKTASVLTGHLNTYLASMQAYYAGALGLGYVNTFYAPYLMGMTDKEIKQIAQEIIFNCSQNAFSRGGQCLFIDTNVDTGVPSYFKNVPAIGPGGKYMFVPAGKTREEWVPLEEACIEDDWCLVYNGPDGNHYAVVREHDGKQTFNYQEQGKVLTYGDFEDEAQRMCGALLDVWYEGDANGHVFEFPKCDFHVDADTFTDPKRKALFDKACRLASHNGSTYFVFDRDSVSLASCCFTGDTKVLVKGGSGAHVQLKSFTELAEASYREARYNLAVYHNGGWSTAGLVKLEGKGKPIYQITTANKKVQKVTCDHIVPTLAGDKRADQVTEDDHILFSTLPLAQSKPNNSAERQALTYAQGIVIGAYLGDGSIEQQHDCKPAVNFSLNAEKYEHLVPYIEQAMKAWDVDGELTLNTPYNNVYPVHIASWGLKERIREWVSGSYCYEKRLNLDCLKEAQEFRRGILDGIYATDGGNSNRIYTTSEGLVDDLEVVCTSLGIQTVIDVSDRTGEDNVVIRGQEYNRNYPVWCVRWYDNGTRRQYSDLYKTKNNSIYFKVTNIETLPEEDTVYCFEIKDGNEPYFTLPNGIITHNCRLKVTITDKSMLLHPEKLRTVGFGNVTVNIPQCAYRAQRATKEGDAWDAFIKEIDNAMDIAVKCHMEKRKFLEYVMKPGGPMWQIAKPANDGNPYMALDGCVYIIGMIGVNDAIQFLYGKQLHESDEAFDMGLKIISHMFHRCKEYSEQYKLTFKLEESPAESAARRLAKADLMYYRPEALQVYKGGDEKYAYYTNSIHIAADADVSLVDRIRKQSMFHSAIESGAIIHAFIGEEKPEPGAIAELVTQVFTNTQAAQITFSPEFTYCQDCGGQQRGLHEKCDQCGSENVVGETRVVGYFSRIQNWNASKRYGELLARQRGQYRVCTVDDEEAK